MSFQWYLKLIAYLMEDIDVNISASSISVCKQTADADVDEMHIFCYIIEYGDFLPKVFK